MSRRAVKFILDIVEEQSRLNEHSNENSGSSSAQPFSASLNGDVESGVEDRIQQLLNDTKKFVLADDKGVAPKATTDNLGENIAHEFTPQNSYHVRLIAPQIQLQSEKNANTVVLLTAKGMQLKVVQIMDKDRVADDVSGLVQRRFSADMDSVQFFVTDQKSFSTQNLSLFSGNRYGAPAGSLWPPWVPLEVMFDFRTSPSGFSRVVKKTSASLRYDKYNSLRLKYNDEVTNADACPTQSLENIESRIDHLWVEFPNIKAVCDSTQYYAIYIIVLDLLLYNEPLEKIRSEKLEKIMLASDFSDLRGAPEMVIRLQNRIRQLEEIKKHFQINAKYLDRQGWEERLRLEHDLASCEDELFFMMKAITTSQRKHDDRSQNNGLLKWWLSSSEIVWHLMRENDEPLAEFQLKNAAYSRIDNFDGSNDNTMEIEDIRGLNLLSNAVYYEMISPYWDETRAPAKSGNSKMLKVKWNMLEAIAGIPVMDHFEVNLFPLKIQLEREVGKKLFEYIFPSDPDVSDNGFMNTIEPENGGFLDESVSSSDKSVPPSDINEPNTRAGSLELRLTPTLTLNDRRPVPSSFRSKSSSMLGLGIGEGHHFRPFKSSSTSRIPHRQKSNESLRVLSRRGTDRSISTLTSSSNGDRSKKFSLHRLGTKDQGDGQSDDLTQMMSRASNYMTLAYVKVHSVVLCLSYKGKGERNFQDVHNFVFRMPSLEYRNKTWSNLDLALQLKKDVIKALISHAGAIIGNKFSHHRPSKQQQQQQSRLREVTNSESPTSSDRSETISIHTYSIHMSGPEDESSSLRQSFQSERNSTPGRTESLASSSRSESASLYGSESLLHDNPGADGSEDVSNSFALESPRQYCTNTSHRATNTSVVHSVVTSPS
jgi:Golgi-body localisation protein domain/RNA pol II promoter Fmp27 protein domain